MALARSAITLVRQPALDNVGVDCHAAVMVVPRFDAGDLGSEFVNCVDTFFWRETAWEARPCTVS